jgi:hypothetical protein
MSLSNVPTRSEAKDDCAGKDQQQFERQAGREVS